jgi:hypothetical protein
MPATAQTAIGVVGVDIGKNTFRIIGLDDRGAIVVRQGRFGFSGNRRKGFGAPRPGSKPRPWPSPPAEIARQRQYHTQRLLL